MNYKSFIKNTLVSACIFFTIITLLYGFIVALLYSDAEEIWLEGRRIILFFLFSALFSIANSILSVHSIPSVVRYLSHYFICGAAFCICILVPALNASTRASFIVVGLSAYTLVYLLIAAVIAVTRTSIKRNREKKEEYTNRF